MYDPNPVKSDANVEKHGVSFDAAERFEWGTALETRDTRRAYDEVRTVALGLIGDDVYALTFTRRGHLMRIISLRLARRKELQRYADFYA